MDDLAEVGRSGREREPWKQEPILDPVQPYVARHRGEGRLHTLGRHHIGGALGHIGSASKGITEDWQRIVQLLTQPVVGLSNLRVDSIGRKPGDRRVMHGVGPEVDPL